MNLSPEGANSSGAGLDDNDRRGGLVPLLQAIAMRDTRVEVDRITLVEHDRLLLYRDNQSTPNDVDELCAGMLMRVRRFRPRRKFGVVEVDHAILDVEIEAFEEV